MNLKQIIASIGTSIEQLLSKVENHNSVAEMIIEEVNQAAAKIRSEVVLTLKHRDTLGEQLAQVEHEISLWQKRALMESNSEDKALACVRVLQRFEVRRTQLQEELTASDGSLEQLHNHLFEVESCLLALHNRRVALVVKKEATPSQLLNNRANAPDQYNIFASWEDALLEHHLGYVTEATARNHQVRQFVLEERLAAAQSRLQELRREHNKVPFNNLEKA